MKKLLPLLLIVALILPPLSPSLPGPTEVTAASPPPPHVTLVDKGITLLAEANYRTQVSLLGPFQDRPYDLERLCRLGVIILRAEDFNRRAI